MSRSISKDGLDLIKRWEGCKLKAYLCPAGKWTIGYGSTGPHVRPDLRINVQEADALLARDIVRFEEAVESAVKVKLTDPQFAALVSFTYNVGIGAFKGSSLVKRLNKGDYASVPAELAKWNKATDPKTGKKRVLEGLSNRRAAEAGLWAKGSFVSGREVVAQPAAALLTKENIATGSGLATAALGAASTSGPLQWAMAAVVVVALGAAVVYAVRRLWADAQ